LKPRYHVNLIEQMVEVPSGSVACGDLFDPQAKTFSVPPVPVITVVSYLEFRSRWTADELPRLHAAKRDYVEVDDLVNLAVAQNSVNLVGESAAAAKASFVSLGVLTPERADVIFASA
jgi:hypothetical protein